MAEIGNLSVGFEEETGMGKQAWASGQPGPGLLARQLLPCFLVTEAHSVSSLSGLFSDSDAVLVPCLPMVALPRAARHDIYTYILIGLESPAT